MKSILIVDDQFEDIVEMKKILEKNKYKISSATNGAQALDLIEGNSFDLILLDIKMPTLSGYDLLSILKQKAINKIKMVYVTIVPKKEAKHLDGVHGYIQKPINEKKLLAEVKRVLEE